MAGPAQAVKGSPEARAHAARMRAAKQVRVTPSPSQAVAALAERVSALEQRRELAERRGEELLALLHQLLDRLDRPPPASATPVDSEAGGAFVLEQRLFGRPTGCWWTGRFSLNDPELPLVTDDPADIATWPARATAESARQFHKALRGFKVVPSTAAVTA